jgi:hypothetical protein
VINTKKSTVKLWNANKFHAWLSSGNVNGNRYTDMMPSKSVMYDFKECLRVRGYNIYKPMYEYTIFPEDVM